MKVLVVDDDPVGLMLASTVVESLGHVVRTADDGELAWQLLTEEPYDVLITDREMPGLGGLALCQRVRDRAASRLQSSEHAPDTYCYVVLVTSHDSEDQALQGLIAGADDYLAKPVSVEELRRRLLVADRITELHRQLQRQHRELAEMGEFQHDLARRDPLTLLPNRRALQEHLDRLDADVERYGRGYSLAVLDVDHFKSFNAAAGHGAGDQALLEVAGALQGQLRRTDGLYRYGGVDFVQVIETSSALAAQQAVERLREAVAQLALAHPGRPGETLSLSAGIASTSAAVATSKDLMADAGLALYEAKQAGRNQCRPALADLEQEAGGVAATTLPPQDDVLDPRPLRQMHLLGGELGRNLADTIVDTWLVQSKDRLSALQDALDDRDEEGLRRAAHSFRGSSATVGAIALSQVCFALERATGWPARNQLLHELHRQAALANSGLVAHHEALSSGRAGSAAGQAADG